jgi:ethanolamine transporter EutH
MQSTGNALGVAVVGFFYIAGLWLPADLVMGHTRFAEALTLLAVLALAVWVLARRIRAEADQTA